MSVKSFISAEAHLAKFGLTSQQALGFLVANIEQPELIFETARQNGVTLDMLSEITNISPSVISDYFTAAGRNSVELTYTSLLINFDPGSLESLVDFNNRDGILSNAALSEAVRPLLNEPLTYDFTFQPIYAHFQLLDEIYDAEELGVGHLDNVPANDESIESLFYGTLINSFSALDEAELAQINAFPEDGDSSELQALLIDVLSEAPSPVVWTDEQLVDLVTDEAVNIIDTFWMNNLVGVLDHSYLGIAGA